MMRKRFVTLSLLPLLSISGAAYANHNYQHHPNAPWTVEKSANDLVGYNSSGVAIYRGEPGVAQGRSMAHQPAPDHSIMHPMLVR